MQVTDLDAFPCSLPPGQHSHTMGAMIRQAATWLERWHGEARQRPPLPGPVPLPPVAPAPWGLDANRLMEDLDPLVRGSYNPWHPGAMAHLDPPPNPASVAGELVCAWLNNNMLAEELSPLLSQLERRLLGWIAQRLGLGEDGGGVMASGGTLCTITALVTARHQRGLDGQQACLYASADCHSSLAKALRVMGLPAAALRLAPTDAAGRLDPHRLEQALKQETEPVLAVVATAGTTIRGAVDPIGPIADICHRRGLWLHVDGAIGAVCGLGQRHQGRVAHMGRADSLTMNPQKWLGIAKASAMVLLRQPQALADTFAAPLAYMEPARVAHGGDCGLQGTRSAEVLKLWLGLRQLGQHGIDDLLDGALHRARVLRQGLAPLPLAMPSGDLHIVCFRPSAAGSSEAWSRHTRQLLLDQGLMLSRPLYRGERHLKAVLGNPFTGVEQIATLVDTISASLSR